MKLILKEDVEKLGNKGEIVEVKDGYGRNFLIPQKKADFATKAAIRAYNDQQKIAEKKEHAAMAKAEKLAKKLSGQSVTAVVAAGEDDKIFGSVTNQNVADLLKEKAYDIDKHDITLPENIKSLGSYKVSVKVFKSVKAEVTLWVIKE